MHDEQALKWFDRQGQARPTQDKHGEDSFQNPISEKLIKLRPRNWRMEGPGKLVADTDQGPLVNFVSPDLICRGTDDNNLPILQKINH